MDIEHHRGTALTKLLRVRHRQMEQKRRKDAKKLSDLQFSVSRGIKNLDAHQTEIPFFPLDEVEGVWDTHTTAHWKDVYNVVNTVVHQVSGHTAYNFRENIVSSILYKKKNNNNNKLYVHTHICMQLSLLTFAYSLIQFVVQVFRSREFRDGPSHSTSDSENEACRATAEVIYVVRFRRVEGDVLDWKKVLNQLLYNKCAAKLFNFKQIKIISIPSNSKPSLNGFVLFFLFWFGLFIVCPLSLYLFFLLTWFTLVMYAFLAVLFFFLNSLYFYLVLRFVCWCFCFPLSPIISNLEIA
ncbi:hypothetical protein RFI_19140 [Reticulomyxa filosa]|uniref:Uncharacterized protein n=1 Tax=Reticulomyxa filosa TaxID=46433 RepID=X6MWX8_RETFI|nr:hypothetical protein RFI_19140 [Reticulomyxa filosa]|eukprot:ETO18146.1 hypothetical protein RFI_19140 [Reticulomyxa filosa]